MTNASGGENTDTYLIFDPGVSTGWARFDEFGNVSDKGICRGLDALSDFLEECEPATVVVYESYRVFKHKANAHIGSKVEAAQAIGMIKAKARKWNAKTVEQPANILPIAAMWSGVELPKNHKISHDIAAYNHGVYYLQKNGIRKSRLLTENNEM